jgi:site-specific DNA recombinase
MTRSPTPRAAIYARYSSDMQSAASIEDQIRLCKERLAAEGWTLVQVFRDAALSGASTLRPGYQALLEGAREAAFDVVVAEALDRLSRDQEDVAALFKRLRFAGIRLVTLAEGEITELHVGLKGTMNALFLKDLADKTRRGLRGRVEAGKSGGGNAYGYRVVRTIRADGTVSAGEREIDVAEAAVVTRIFRAYAAGESPKKIALQLNAEGIAGPRGGAWSPSTINSNRERGTGILNNELYIGRLVWNRLRYVKDPETGRRRSRANAEDRQVATEVPQLRVVPQELWDAVKARQAKLEHGTRGRATNEGPTNEGPRPFWSQQRPRYLFSGLMRCGVCGGGYSKSGASTFACSTARNKGPTACSNTLSIRRDKLEATVLDGLRGRLMDPDLFKVFVTEFTAEWNRLQAAAGAEREAREADLERVRRQIERLVDALADGTMSAAAVKGRLNDLEQRRLALEAELANSPAPAPRLHPELAEIYREKVAGLAEVLARDDTTAAREAIRALVEAIVLVPEAGRLRVEVRVEVRGELAAILALSNAGAGRRGGRPSEAEMRDLALQVKLVAGRGFEPLTFRL